MTGYRRTYVWSPEEAFDRIAEEFYVENRTDEEIEVIHEEENVSNPFENPVQQVVVDEVGSDDEYEAMSRNVVFEEDVPEELQDDTTEDESNSEWSDEEVIETLTVLEAIKKHETDQSHVECVTDAQGRIQEIFGKELQPKHSGCGDITCEEINTALDLLEDRGVDEMSRDPDPNRLLQYALEFVEVYTHEGRAGFPRITE